MTKLFIEQPRLHGSFNEWSTSCRATSSTGGVKVVIPEEEKVKDVEVEEEISLKHETVDVQESSPQPGIKPPAEDVEVETTALV